MPNNAKNTHKDTDKQGQKPDYPDFLETSQRIMDLWIRMGKMLGEQEAPLKRFENFGNVLWMTLRSSSNPVLTYGNKIH